MNYEKEVEKLNQGTETWKPEVGIHEFVVLAEPEATEYTDEETGKVTPQIKIPVSVKQEEKDWFVSVGKTHQSAYGQLMVIGKHLGKLGGQKLQLVVQSSTDKTGKTKKSYTFPEAAKILQSENVETETVK